VEEEQEGRQQPLRLAPQEDLLAPPPGHLWVQQSLEKAKSRRRQHPQLPLQGLAPLCQGLEKQKEGLHQNLRPVPQEQLLAPRLGQKLAQQWLEKSTQRQMQGLLMPLQEQLLRQPLCQGLARHCLEK
jgi:hypothetical protein